MMNYLVNDAQTPYYVFNEKQFITNFKKIKKAFKKHYKNFVIGYSFKTNYLPRACQIIKELGGYAEVVSPMEFKLAKELGYKSNQIIYNGVCKDWNILDFILEDGILNVDNIEEFRRFADLAIILRININIGLRLNFDIGNGLLSRFGIDVDSKDFDEIFETFKINPYIQIKGIHCHISKARELHYWEKRVDAMLKLAPIFGRVEYIDFGSNLYSEMEEELAKQYGDNLPTIEDYAKVIAGKFAEEFTGDYQPMLIIEPGTPLAANSMAVVSTVQNIKEVQGKVFATMNCSKYNLGCIAEVKNVPIEIYTSGIKHYQDVDMVGYTCIEDDVVHRHYYGPIEVGDKVVFKNVGAYSVTMANNFIKPNIAIYNEEGEMLKVPGSFYRVFDEFIY